MKAVLDQIQNRLFGAKDTVCLERLTLITEAHQQHEDEPPAIRRALAFQHLLEHMTLDVESNPVFAGNTSSRPRAWMIIPEFSTLVDLMAEIEHAELKGFLDGKIPPDMAVYWAQPGKTANGVGGIGHMSVDFGRVVRLGLNHALREIEARQDAGAGKQRTFRRAMRIACLAVIAWAKRYADIAERAAARCVDPLVAACHRRVAAACRHVPAKPARNLFEGLQAMLLIHLATVLEGEGPSTSIGLPDRALAHFAREVEEHPDESADLISAFLLGVAANSHQGSSTNTQAITVGGADQHAGDCSNAVTLAFMKAFGQTPVSDPHLFIRWHPRLDRRVRAEAARMLSRGRSMPLVVNDEQVVPGLIEA